MVIKKKIYSDWEHTETNWTLKSGKRTCNQEDIRDAETCDLPDNSKTRKLLGHVGV